MADLLKREWGEIGRAGETGSLRRLLDTRNASAMMGGSRTGILSRIEMQLVQGSDCKIPGYRTLEFIDEGAFGKVFRAERLADGEVVALKVVRLVTRVARNVLREYRAIKALRGIRQECLLPVDNVLLLDKQCHLLDESTIESIRAEDKASTVAFIVYEMPLAETSLAKLLEEATTGLFVPELLAHMERVALGLDALNIEADIQHRDVKPENILVVDGKAVLADFGEAADNIKGGRTQTVGGALTYMAPEVLHGKTYPQSDQYSFALTYFHLRTGELPTRQSIGSPDISNLDLITNENERQIIARATAPEPADRFPRCMDMVRRLKSCLLGDENRPSGEIRVGDSPIPGFELMKEIGRGAFGTVWKARKADGSLCALKWVSHQRDALLLEYRAFQEIKRKNLQHPHLLGMGEIWLLDGQFIQQNVKKLDAELSPNTVASDYLSEAFEEWHLVIELELAESNLETRLKKVKASDGRRRGIDTRELIKYMKQASSALDCLNQAGIIHRDIKPQNLLLKNGQIKIADFGSAAINQTSQSETATMKIGTPLYMPPEQLAQVRSKSSDQYSLACTFLHLHKGQPPKRNIVDVQYALCGPNERKVIKRATQLEPADRYDSVGQFVTKLSAALKRDEGGGIPWWAKVAAALLAIFCAFQLANSVLTNAVPNLTKILFGPTQDPPPPTNGGLKPARDMMVEGDRAYEKENEHQALAHWTDAKRLAEELYGSLKSLNDQQQSSIRKLRLRLSTRLSNWEDVAEFRPEFSGDEFSRDREVADLLQIVDFLHAIRNQSLKLEDAKSLENLVQLLKAVGGENGAIDDSCYELVRLERLYDEICELHRKRVEQLERDLKDLITNRREEVQSELELLHESNFVLRLDDSEISTDLGRLQKSVDSKIKELEIDNDLKEFPDKLQSAERSFVLRDVKELDYSGLFAVQQRLKTHAKWQLDWDERLKFIYDVANVSRSEPRKSNFQSSLKYAESPGVSPADVCLALHFSDAALNATTKSFAHAVVKVLNDSRKSFPASFRFHVEFALWKASDLCRLTAADTHLSELLSRIDEARWIQDSHRSTLVNHVKSRIAPAISLDDPFDAVKRQRGPGAVSVYDMLGNLPTSSVLNRDPVIRDARYLAEYARGKLTPESAKANVENHAAMMCKAKFFHEQYRKKKLNSDREASVAEFNRLFKKHVGPIQYAAVQNWIDYVFVPCFGKNGLYPLPAAEPGSPISAPGWPHDAKELLKVVLLMHKANRALNEKEKWDLGGLIPNSTTILTESQTRSDYFLHRAHALVSDSPESSRMVQAEALFNTLFPFEQYSPRFTQRRFNGLLNELTELVSGKWEPRGKRNAINGEILAIKATEKYESNLQTQLALANRRPVKSLQAFTDEKEAWERSLAAFGEALDTKASAQPRWRWLARKSDNHKRFAVTTLQMYKAGNSKIADLQNAEINIAWELALTAVNESKGEPYSLAMLGDAYEDKSRYLKDYILEKEDIIENFQLSANCYLEAIGNPAIREKTKKYCVDGLSRSTVQYELEEVTSRLAPLIHSINKDKSSLKVNGRKYLLACNSFVTQTRNALNGTHALDGTELTRHRIPLWEAASRRIGGDISLKNDIVGSMDKLRDRIHMLKSLGESRGVSFGEILTLTVDNLDRLQDDIFRR